MGAGEMRISTIGLLSVALCILLLGAAQRLPAAAEVRADPTLPPFSVEYRVGPSWRADKPPNEQEHFAARSAHLARLRSEGVLRMGARYADKGLVVLVASPADSARALVEQDPSVAGEPFVFELHTMRVFYDGSIGVADTTR
jgi:hypothetical protein